MSNANQKLLYNTVVFWASIANIFFTMLIFFLFSVFTSAICQNEPLLLSTYLDENKADEAKRLSSVDSSLFLGIESYSGYITVDKDLGSHTFFWYFPHPQASEVPLLVWFQGGPGDSSMYGLFQEMGPFKLDKDNNLIPNEYTWHKNMSLLYIDNPVGTGFSIAKEEGIPTNQTTIGEHLYSFITQFLQIYTDVRNSPFYISGESYAGKYVPTMARKIHTMNENSEFKINLQGIAIQSAFTNITIFNERKVKNLYYELGFISFEEYDTLSEDEIKELPDLISDVYNIINIDEDTSFDERQVFLNRDDIQAAIHAATTNFTYTNLTILMRLLDDRAVASDDMEFLLNHYKVLLFNGQFDTTCSYVTAEEMHRNFNWEGREEFLNAKRTKWLVDNHFAGFVRKARKFTEVMVRNSGHFITKDQPEWALKLINSFVFDTEL